MTPSLKLALIHFNIQHKEAARNRENLLSLVAEAASNGAELVAAPEMSISGYAFDSRKDILPHVESQSGPTLTALAEAARTFGIYVCIGMAEIDSHTRILYNSAFALDPEGRIRCRYRKINAEGRWASPGDPKQDNTFETPWGRVGMLICSDSYHALMPRVTALRGANLLLVLANWPPIGLNPCEIWRARALENGYYVAGCNRTGTDLTMDCREAPSFACDAFGNPLLDKTVPDSGVLYLQLPLDDAGRLDGKTREACMADRRIAYYRDCCLNLKWTEDMTDFLKLPSPGALNVYCVAPHEKEHPVDALARHLDTAPHARNGLFLLPAHFYPDAKLESLSTIAAERQIHIAVRNSDDPDHTCHLFDHAGKARRFPLPSWPFDGDDGFQQVDVGPARLLFTPFAAMHHPEPAIAAAKLGCDIAISLEDHFTPEDRLLAGVRTIENLAMVVCAKNDAGIWFPPEGHQRWEETAASPGEVGCYVLDTHKTRRKRFQDLIDFEKLLEPNGVISITSPEIEKRPLNTPS